jgi:sulfite reductase beta subunit-like hemoprotein
MYPAVGVDARLAAVARQRGQRWLHLTTRQQIELHHIHARQVPAVLVAPS